jgi:hypothetical protein
MLFPVFLFFDWEQQQLQQIEQVNDEMHQWT